MNTRRLFFALWPDDRQREQLREPINAVARSVEGRVVDRRNWHVTLNFIGVFPEQRIPILHEKAAAIEVQPFRLHFDRLEFWPRPKIAALCVQLVPPELQALVNDLEAAMRSIGIRPENRNYRPHITTVRNARQFSTERLPLRVSTEWARFELMESVGGRSGVRYRPLKQVLTP